MVSESGPTEIRYAPAPQRFDLTDASREVVMDRHPGSTPWRRRKCVREEKIVEDAAAGSGRIPDSRRFVFVEACTELANAAVAFSVHAPDASGTARWFDADRGLPQFRIVRTGCFRGARAAAAGAGTPDAIRFRAYVAAAGAEGPRQPIRRPFDAGPRSTGVFTVADSYEPLPRWILVERPRAAPARRRMARAARFDSGCGPEVVSGTAS